MNNAVPRALKIGEFSFDPASGSLSRGERVQRLEPKVARLLSLLAERAGQVVPREDIAAVLWPDVVVGEDALPRSVSKLRRAFGDDPKRPHYVETMPKRGYRLVADVAYEVEVMADRPAESVPEAAEAAEAATFGVDQEGSAAELIVASGSRGLTASLTIACLVIIGVVAWWLWRSGAPGETPSVGRVGGVSEQLVERADDFYIHITRSGNESAIELYEQALAADPDFARAHAGLANALVQRVLRYPTSETPAVESVNLGSALASGRLQTPEARHHLERAMGLAERAVRLDPSSAASHKALGFVSSALGRLEEAERIYEQAVELDRDAWDVLINLGDIHEIRGLDQEALRYYQLAYQAMERVYAEQPQRVGPWLAELGAAIGERQADADRLGEAEVWFRRVLGYAPLHPKATCDLAALLRSAGDPAAASRLQQELAERTGESGLCAQE